MFGLLLVVVLAVWAIARPQTIQEVAETLPDHLAGKVNKLWSIAQDSLKERKYLRAEKALLTILHVDERNATAYNRLGILYAKQRAYREAIECFEIAQSLDPSPSSLHNVGLIYFETEDFEKASLAFEQALEMEDNIASRHIAYAKVQEKLGNNKKMIDHLETAVRIEPSIQGINILADAYDRTGESEKASKLREYLNKALSSKNPPRKHVQQVSRVVS